MQLHRPLRSARLLVSVLAVLCMVTMGLAQTTTNSLTFRHTGNLQTFVVPPHVYWLNVVAYGARGGSESGNAGGLGGKIDAQVPVCPGDVLQILVGDAGRIGGGGGGGGGTYVAVGSGYSAFASPLIVAGGGGGASDLQSGGRGGGLFGAGFGGPGPFGGGGGGGALTNGGSSSYGSGGGQAAVNGGAGGLPVSSGVAGGYGGGGASYDQHQPGGGGGYEGGAAPCRYGPGSYGLECSEGGSSFLTADGVLNSETAGGARTTLRGRVDISWVAPVPVVFDYTGSLQTYVVPANVNQLHIVAEGAAGFGAWNYGPFGGYGLLGGFGGRIEALVPVSAGDVLQILVGGAGQGYFFDAGGGGGTFVGVGSGYSAFASPLIVAGGGGGTGDQFAGGVGGWLLGGTGVGGSIVGAYTYSGGAGGGAMTNGAGGSGGKAAVNGGAGGTGFAAGGYGGGGAGAGYHYPGAGGGYDGGDVLPAFEIALGGSSFVTPSGTLINNTPGGGAYGSNGMVTITAAAPRPATTTVRVGAPANPTALMPGATRPVIGSIWSPFIDHSTFMPTAAFDGLIIAFGPTNIPLPFGTLLCDLSTPNFILSGAPGAPFNVAIPDYCGLVGVSLCAQGLSVGTSIQFTNALDVDLSTF